MYFFMVNIKHVFKKFVVDLVEVPLKTDALLKCSLKSAKFCFVSATHRSWNFCNCIVVYLYAKTVLFCSLVRPWELFTREQFAKEKRITKLKHKLQVGPSCASKLLVDTTLRRRLRDGRLESLFSGRADVQWKLDVWCEWNICVVVTLLFRFMFTQRELFITGHERERRFIYQPLPGEML